MRLYISPSKQPTNRYAVAGTNEQAQMEGLSRELVNQLKNYTVDVKLATLTMGIGQSGRPLEASKWNADFYLAVHSNAGGGGTANGAEAYYHSKTPIGKTFGSNFLKRMEEVNPRTSRRSKPLATADTMFSEVREPYKKGIPAVLIEVDFHDNPTEARWIIDNKKAIAGAIIKALMDTWPSIKPKGSVTQPNPSTNFLVKVKDPALNIRAGAGVNQKITGVIKDKGTYTIIETKKASDGATWGKLKSGVGWINIGTSYVERV